MDHFSASLRRTSRTSNQFGRHLAGPRQSWEPYTRQLVQEYSDFVLIRKSSSRGAGCRICIPRSAAVGIFLETPAKQHRDAVFRESFACFLGADTIYTYTLPDNLHAFVTHRTTLTQSGYRVTPSCSTFLLFYWYGLSSLSVLGYLRTRFRTCLLLLYQHE